MCSFIHEVTPRAPTEPKMARLTILVYILRTTIYPWSASLSCLVVDAWLASLSCPSSSSIHSR